ncbi:M56 family metallopeptidase [Chryseolinea lacunae]|uniref:M48 family metalloprotease n=1 Tax=Chryseolinea lacunae TaxID=2801331 RepID=A0ABS1KYY2_9BACT|nr:M56 family metallopeptidase [Chryseolinea lacunae]MBL0744676.1 M48 family metalloprotease [Chryseolinea lacunae]
MSTLAIRISEMIGLTILHSLWQITLLWFVLVTLLKLFPKASSTVRYTLAISTLMLCVLTTAATAVYEWQWHATSEQLSTLPDRTTQSVQTLSLVVSQTLLSKIADALNAAVPILAWGWCAGLVVMGTRFGGSFFYLKKLRAPANIEATAPVWQQEVKRLSVALGLRCEVVLATSGRISSPITLGDVSPIILLPAALLSGMSTAQLEAILVHELYHIKRRDYLLNICQALVEVLLFYHPALWHINTIIREAREHCCDDQTVGFCGDAMVYARALTELQEMNTFTKPTLAMSATGPNAENFSHRIKRLFNIYPNPAQARSKGIFAIGFLMVYLGIVLVSANISTAHPAEPEKNSTKTNINDTNTHSQTFPDSLSVGNQLYVAQRKRITPRPVAVEKIRSVGIQHPDTTARQQSLEDCLRKSRLLLKMVGIYGPGDQSLKFPTRNAIQVLNSPTRISRSLNQSSRTAKLNLTEAKDNEAIKADSIMIENR